MALVAISVFLYACSKDPSFSELSGTETNKKQQTSNKQSSTKKTYNESLSTGLDSEKADNREQSTTNLSKSLAIVDIMVRSINEKEYVKELYLVDFVDQNQIPIVFAYSGYIFSDNGEGNDKRSRDGIYSSRETFEHNESYPFRDNYESISVKEGIIVSEKFECREKLLSYDYPFGYKEPILRGERFVITVNCDFKWVCGCWGSCCGWHVDKCNVEVSWEPELPKS